jgi:hypothetical protein
MTINNSTISIANIDKILWKLTTLGIFPDSDEVNCKVLIIREKKESKY